MEDSKRQNRWGKPGKDAPDMRITGIDFNLGPDADDRLLRLFTILIKLADDDLPFPGADSSRGDCGEMEE